MNDHFNSRRKFILGVSSGLVMSGNTLITQREQQRRMTNVPYSDAKDGSTQEATLVARIPSDYDTLQEAIDTLCDEIHPPCFLINLLIESGHQPSSGVSVANGDYGYFLISSEDTVVSLNNDFEGTFLSAKNAKAPVLNCLIDAGSFGFRGCWYIDVSEGIINPGCGVKNVRERGLYVNNSRVTAVGSIFTGAGQDGGNFGRSLWATRCAHVNLDGEADMSNCMGDTCIYVSRASVVHAASITASVNNGKHVIWVHRGSIYNGQSGDYSGGNTRSIWANRASTVVINDSLVHKVDGDGIVSNSTSRVTADDVILTASSINDGNGVKVSSGGVVSFTRGVISEFSINGVLVNQNGQFSAPFAVIRNSGANGIIARRLSKVNISNGDVSGSLSGRDLTALQGSEISAFDTTTTNSPSTPNINDTNFKAFNVIEGNKGIIWS